MKYTHCKMSAQYNCVQLFLHVLLLSVVVVCHVPDSRQRGWGIFELIKRLYGTVPGSQSIRWVCKTSVMKASS